MNMKRALIDSSLGCASEAGETVSETKRKISLTLAQAIPKAGKMDLIVKTAAELGTDVIVPFSVRPVGKPHRRGKSR